jgi:maltose O-acetyltransferase
MVTTDEKDDAEMAEQKNKMLAGELYNAEDPELVEDRRKCLSALERYNATPDGERMLREQILAELLGSVGEGVTIATPLRCEYGYNVSIGARSHLSHSLTIHDWAEVSIGEDVNIGPGVMLLAASRPLDPDERRAGFQFAKPVRVGDGAWIAAGALIFPGVTVGADAVVRAGSVVVDDVPPLSLVVGNPARVVRQL